jgi:malonate-semialdehyde dehydrogenase (acetylating)/methylmalonate-semialdehyde dehydrogenase
MIFDLGLGNTIKSKCSFSFKEKIMSYTINHFINNASVAGKKDRLHPLHNPATDEVIGQVAYADSQQMEQVIAAAKAAFPGWSAIPAARRARILFKYKELLEKHLDELAALVTAEHGKTLNDAKGSIMRGIEVVEFACGIPNLLKGWFSEDVGTDVDSHTIRQPLGVCAGITPFNFPAMIPLWMFPLAVACGNTFILKPSEKDPSCPLRLAELFKEAGAPAGVLNVINGDQEVVNVLLTHPDIAAVSFVGSTPVAEYIHKTAAAHGKRVQAFGGAKNHCVVMPDADLDQAADAIVGAAYGSAGERCMAISVVVAVGDQLADTLIAKLKPRVHELKIGPGTDPKVEMGPLINKQHLAKVKSYVDLGVKEGAQLVVDGRNFKAQGHEKGYFMGGCLFDKVTPTMRIYQEEIFGPVLCVVRAPDFSTALQLVSDHEYGNGTAIFTRDGNTARTFASKVRVGMVGINIPIPVPTPYHAFGGWKRSIFADIHMQGTESVSFYTKLKTITSRWPTGIRAGAEFMMPTHK